MPAVIGPSGHGNNLQPEPLTDTSVRPADGASFKTTPVASDGPLFVTVIVYVMFEPGSADRGPVFVMDISALVTTAFVVVDVLSARLLSNAGELAVAVFVTLDAFEATAKVAVIVVFVPFGSEAIVHGKPPQAPLTETRVRPAPGVSLTVTFAASDGPLFPTVML
jgi:hypothetical protein